MKTVLVTPKLNTMLSPTEDTQFVIDCSELENDSQYSVDVQLEKPGVSGEIIVLYSAKAGKDINLVTKATHMVPNTSCTTKIRGVIGDNGNATYIGKIIINKEAQQTSSFLEDNVLVVGENTHHRADPILEIEADDVSASHGSTTGRVDESQLYYLQSRGLTRAEAQQIIVEGFFEDILGTIVDKSVASVIRKTLT